MNHLLRHVASLFGAGIVAAAVCFGAPTQVDAQYYGDYYEWYDYYDVGYDTEYDDDWFYDYYEYDAGAYDDEYGHYDDYDYDADVFDWEEDGLFE